MAVTTTLIFHSPNPNLFHNHKRTLFCSNSIRTRNPIKNTVINGGLLGAGLALTLSEPASALDLPLLGSSMQLIEPANALSLPTWAIHVSSVVEWIAAMALVWQYGDKSGFESWKGLSWGMVPLLGGAFCACTWHFFYNSESLEVQRMIVNLLVSYKELLLRILIRMTVSICPAYVDFEDPVNPCLVLVALQAALTVIGNATMCYAAYRIYKSTEESSQNL